jgi:hypothetical protein
MLGAPAAIHRVLAASLYIGFESKEQCTGARIHFCPLQMPRGIHILNVHVVR